MLLQQAIDINDIIGVGDGLGPDLGLRFHTLVLRLAAARRRRLVLVVFLFLDGFVENHAQLGRHALASETQGVFRTATFVMLAKIGNDDLIARLEDIAVLAKLLEFCIVAVIPDGLGEKTELAGNAVDAIALLYCVFRARNPSSGLETQWTCQVKPMPPWMAEKQWVMIKKNLATWHGLVNVSRGVDS